MNEYEKKLIRLYLKAETEIINEIARLRSLGLADYHAVSALKRVRAILSSTQSEAWEYAPRAIESYFYVRRPELRTLRTTAEGAMRAYISAIVLTSEQHEIVNRLVVSLMADLNEASDTVVKTLEDYLVGRRENDPFRSVGLEYSAEIEELGSRRRKVDQFVRELQRDGITAFVDKAGRHWSLHTYASMVTRTTTRQAEVLTVLTQDPEQDLYTIKGADDPCGLCAPYQRRVYSRSGKDHRFPPLADAFGKIDPDGPNELTNTWLNIHPNCRCAVVPWTPAGRSKKEIRDIERFSNPATNPYTVDPRSKKAIEAYRKREKGREKWLEDYRQWERYRVTIPGSTPKTFSTFQRHKKADDEKYRSWVVAYREANRKGE